MRLLLNKKFIYVVIAGLIAAIFCVAFTLYQTKALASPNKYNDYVPGKAIVCVDGGAAALMKSSNSDKLGSFTVDESLMTLDSSRQVQELIGAHSPNLKNQLYNMNPQFAKNNTDKKCEILLVDCQNTEKFVVKEFNPEPVPNPVPDPSLEAFSASTGDNSNIIIYVLLIVALSSLVILKLRKN